MSVDKGKGKGKGKSTRPTERDPLLASSSRFIATQPLQAFDTTPNRSHFLPPRLRSILFTVLIVLASLLVSAILFVALLAYSFRPSPSELSALQKDSFKYLPPEGVKVLNITEDGILVNITVRCAINADRALGIQGFADDDEKAAAVQSGLRGIGADWWEVLRRWTAHKALDQLPLQAISVHIPDHINIFPHHVHSQPLLSVSVLSPLLVPLLYGLPLGSSPSETYWLVPVTFTAIAKPIASTGQLWEYAQHAWADGQARVVVGISKVEVELPGYEAWWVKYTRAEKQDLVMEVDMPGE